MANSTEGCAQNSERQKAITATAHKLARMIYHLITTRKPYDESVFATLEVSYRQRTANRLKTQAHALGFTLVPTNAATV
ncbi:MAG: hypothetical protein ACRD4O_07395 [Bryobacteraceae bacterium]